MATESKGHGPPQQPPTTQATDITATKITETETHNDDNTVKSDSKTLGHISGKTAGINVTTTPAHKLSTGVDISSTSPLSRLASPTESDFSFSPPSAGFLSLLGAATATPLTPLSSLDGGDAWCPPSVGSSAMAEDRDHDAADTGDVIGDDNGNNQDTIFPFGDMPKSAGSEKGEAPQPPLGPGAASSNTTEGVGAVAAANTAKRAQSPAPIRATGAATEKGGLRDTRSKKSTSDNSAGASDENNTIATLRGSASTSTVDAIRDVNSAKDDSKDAKDAKSTDSDASVTPIIAPSQDARKRCETSNLSDSAAQPAPQPAPQHSGTATQRVTPHTRARGENLLPNENPSLHNTAGAAKPLAGAFATTSFTTKIVQPKAVKPKPSPPPPPQQPAIVRTTSSHGDLPLRQPVPDPNGGSIGIVGNIAQLEETAEQLSSTGSIETAIREAHQELKRSDSRRSSILAASIRQASSRATSVADPSEAPPLRREFSRQSSIIELNSAARAGAFSPNDYIMSPSSSIAGGVTRQRSTSKASSTGSAHGSLMANILGISDQSITGGDDIFPFLSRHGPGKSSVRSARSGKLSMPEIAELEPPSALTQDALDEADRRIAAGEDNDDDDTIRASAHQHVDVESDGEGEAAIESLLTPNQESWAQQPALGSSAGTDSALLSSRSPPPIARPSVTDFLGYASPPQYVPNPAGYPEYSPSGHMEMHSQNELHHANDAETAPHAINEHDTAHDTEHHADVENELERPTTSGSGGTFDQAQLAFDDFDGVHCDPDVASLRRSIRGGAPSILERPPSEEPAARQTPPAAFKQRLPMPPRPTSYLDPQTGQQMLFYPARVPAMLQLPQKLSRNPKASERNARRSQVMSMMMQNRSPELRGTKPERASRVWLPDPMEGDSGSHFMGGSDTLSPDLTSNSISPNPLSPALSGDAEHPARSPTRQSLLRIDANTTADASPEMGSPTGDGEQADLNHLRRPSRLIDSDRRKSRLSTMTKLPAQLRASAYFDMPSTTANIEVKNGSAMDTLDSILDAAAAAPVSAFTDHQFAGALGSEVYGTEKKKTKKKAGANAAGKQRPGVSPVQNELPTSKSRGSFMSMMGHIRKVSEPVHDGRSEFEVPRVRRRLSKNFDNAMLSPSLSEGTNGVLAPDADERVSDDEEYEREHGEEEEEEEEDSEEEEDEDELAGAAFQGAPTTLLAELQLRKQQQKLRTRPINQAFPNGMHSTLLELDAVAEIERRTRKGRKVNLAWEDPSMQILDNQSDDEDVPLGMLYAAKAAGQNDISAVVAEMNRPLGLMEKKELEDNEPLSRRRDRLQGRDTAVSMYLGPNFGSNAVKRQSMLTLTPTLAALNQNGAGLPDNQGEDGEKEGDEDAVEEVEDEPLAARLQRIKAKEESELPRARPVSMAFSEELLNQFVDPEEEAKERERELEKEKAKAQLPAEEEETLGQRRRRLQAEKEAREQEMGGSGLAVNGQALHALTGGTDRLSRRLSMANVLSAHPADTARGAYNPREAERIRREQEAARAAFDKEQKMAAMRAQMPRNISNTSLGGGVTKAGGYLGGRLNDGTGGIGGLLNRTTMQQHHDGPGVGHWANPGTMGGPMGNASVLNLAPSASMGNMAGMNNVNGMGTMTGMNGMSGMGMGGVSYGSGLNTMGMNAMNGMGMGMNNRSTSFGGYGGMPQQQMMGNNGMAFGAPAYNGYAGMQMPMQMQMPQMGIQMGGMPMQMPMQQPPQADRVERWRQGVLP